MDHKFFFFNIIILTILHFLKDVNFKKNTIQNVYRRRVLNTTVYYFGFLVGTQLLHRNTECTKLDMKKKSHRQT